MCSPVASSLVESHASTNNVQKDPSSPPAYLDLVQAYAACPEKCQTAHQSCLPILYSCFYLEFSANPYIPLCFLVATCMVCVLSFRKTVSPAHSFPLAGCDILHAHASTTRHSGPGKPGSVGQHLDANGLLFSIRTVY